MATKLGILAGGGPLPGRIVQSCLAAGREVFVIAFENESDPKTCEGVPHVWMPLGKVGATINRLKAENCTDVVLAGPVRRPSFSKLKPDMRAIKLLGKIRKAAGQGDDAILSVLVEELESENFRVVGADDLLGDVVAREVILSDRVPGEIDQKDIELGVRVARALGALDVGQAVVVQQGVVLGVEAIEGTDALLGRCQDLKQEGQGGVLVKLIKTQQERRADLPTIGADTVRHSAEAGLNGIAVEAGQSLILDRAEVVVEANRLGLYVAGIKA
ncbi:MAG: UDP-2,3-diacylglucosamine diphosphatase LpxI [Pseudomonadota bacterium]|nr:UDP-2,3-diacylglucosamine diphosphatase LpxI [Pseudomonadota bacterium]